MIDSNDLCENNLKLAYKLANDYYKKLNGFIDLEELQAICFLGLVKASKNFNKDKNFEFSTFAYSVMKNEIMQYLLKNKNNTISINQPLINNEDLEFENILKSDFDLELLSENSFNITNLYKYIELLTEPEQTIIKNMLNEKTLKMTAIELNLTLSQTTTLYRKAINDLRHKFFKY